MSVYECVIYAEDFKIRRAHDIPRNDLPIKRPEKVVNKYRPGRRRPKKQQEELF